MLVYFSDELETLFIVDDTLTIRKDSPNDDMILMEINTNIHTWLPRKKFEELHKDKIGKL